MGVTDKPCFVRGLVWDAVGESIILSGKRDLSRPKIGGNPMGLLQSPILKLVTAVWAITSVR